MYLRNLKMKRQMKKLLKYIPVLLLALVVISCDKDDDNKSKTEPPRDENEVYQENIAQIKTFLETHTYHLSASLNGVRPTQIIFDTLAGANANKTPLINDPNLKTKTVKPDKVEYTLYYLQVRKGDSAAYQPTFGDKVAMSFRMENLNNVTLDESKYPMVIDIPRSNDAVITKGTTAGIIEFSGASGFTANPDGTISYNNDYGIGAIFIPSGLGYFQSSPFGTKLEQYAPIIVSFQLVKAVQMDHDNDGIPSYMEDLNNNGFLKDDDTDGDFTANFIDGDDDGDGIATKDEIIVHPTQNGIITPADIEFPDADNDGIPDYLDAETVYPTNQ